MTGAFFSRQLLQLLRRHRLYRLAIARRLTDIERDQILIRQALGDLDVDAVVVTQRHCRKSQTVSYTHLTLPTICSV